MKTKLLAAYILASLASASLEAQTPVPDLHLSGIVALPGIKCAVLETTTSSSSSGSSSWHILQEGQREGEVEMVEIHPESATAKLDLHSQGGLTSVGFSGRAGRMTAGMLLDHASLDPVLKLYGDLSERTLLRYPLLPKASLTVTAPVANRTEAARRIEQALAGVGIAVIPDGARFIMVVPQKQVSFATPHATELKTQPAAQTEILPAGAINFPNTDSAQVMQIYAELAGRQLDRTFSLPVAPSFVVKFQSQTPLTRQEVLYALDTLFAWSGVKMVPSGADKLRPVPLLQSK